MKENVEPPIIPPSKRTRGRRSGGRQQLKRHECRAQQNGERACSFEILA
jgi:hypothetical protein